MTFECDRCGLCCSHIGGNELYNTLDRGDGVCIFLKENLCSIYETRPLLCRIYESWEQLFSSQMSAEEFFELNYKSCRTLKNTYKQGETDVPKISQ